MAAEPGLYENLRSFLDQDYPPLQIVLGVNDPQDGALDAARALIRDFPEDVALVVDRRIRGSNQKVSNLENMLPAARHDILVLADSDMRVDRRYLAAVTAPLGEPGVGVVTCLYKAVSTGGLWSDLGALQINFGFLPNAFLADVLASSAAAALAPRSRSAVRPSAASVVSRRCATSSPTTVESVTLFGRRGSLSCCRLISSTPECASRLLSRCGGTNCAGRAQCAGFTAVGFVGSVATYPLAIALSDRCRHRIAA